MNSFLQLAEDFIGLLFPNTCNGCGTPLFPGEEQICTVCLHDLAFTNFENDPDNAVHRLFWGQLPCQNAMAMLYFRKGSRVQNLIHQLKYHDKTTLGITLGKMLGHRICKAPSYADIDLVIPIPLHPKKQRNRGYNQCDYIAQGISAAMGIPICTKVLQKQKQTATQTKKSRYQRFENIKEVFNVYTPEKLRDKHILLIDDVVTTGSTFQSAGKLLLDCGISKLSIAAVAFAE